jgi:hypothetical protein
MQFMFTTINKVEELPEGGAHGKGWVIYHAEIPGLDPDMATIIGTDMFPSDTPPRKGDEVESRNNAVYSIRGIKLKA